MGAQLVATDVAPKSDLPCMVILKSERSNPLLEVYEPFTIRRLLELELESTPMHGQKTAQSMEHRSVSLFMNAFLYEKVSTRPEEVWGISNLNTVQVSCTPSFKITSTTGLHQPLILNFNTNLS